MMDKILAITRKELYTTFTDRNLLILMLAAPLAISVIVGLVFGGLGSSGSSPIADIPVAVVNLDAGAEQQGQPTNYGDTIAAILTSTDGAVVGNQTADCPLAEAPTQSGDQFAMSLDEILAAQQIDDLDAARSGVENGDFAAAVIIPADYSARLVDTSNPLADPAAFENAVSIEIYANSGQALEGTIVRSIVDGINKQMLTGNVAISASIGAILEYNTIASLGLAVRQNDPEVAALFGCAFSGDLATVSVAPQTLATSDEPDDNLPAGSLTTLILIQTGSAQAVFFAMFAGQAMVLTIIGERRAGTLQRMLLTPTPRRVILTGKLFASFVTAVIQLVILLLALTAIASILEGRPMFIWGSNLLALAAVIVALSLCVSGLGVLLTSLARTPEQVGPIGAVINIVMALTGGGFGVPPILPLAYISFIYWGTDAFFKLAANDSDIWLNMAVLMIYGLVMFGVGSVLFSRRVEVI